MERRRKHQIHLLGTQDAASCQYDTHQSLLSQTRPNEAAAYKNPFSRPLVSHLKPDDAQRLARNRSTNIFASFNELSDILDRHEATIQKRWAKKSKKQRQAILLKAWPNMAMRHRPDIEAFKTLYFQYEPSRWEESQHRDPFMWPYINQEDLLKPKTLSLLLNSRGRNHPYTFAVADLEVVHLGKVTNAIIPIFVSQTTMILHGATTPDEYGSFLAWDKHPHAYDLIKKGKQFLPEEGFTILEAQERLLSFLVNCCHQVLHDIPKDIMTSGKYPVKPQPQPQRTKETETTGYESLAVMMAEAPYRVPAELDLERIEALISARRSAAEDHLWALREDPGYFSDTMRERADHRLDMLKTVTGKTQPDLLDKAGRATFWAGVIRRVLYDAYYQLDALAYLQKQAHDLRVLQVKHAAAISPSEDLPKDYLHSILKFRSVLHAVRRLPMEEVNTLAMASPSFRGFFYCEQEDGKPGWHVKENENRKMEKVEEDLLNLLEMFSPDEPDVHTDVQDVLEELDRLLNSDSRAKELMSPLIASVVGDISILSHCCRLLDNYGPWGRTFAATMQGCMAELLKDTNAEQVPWIAKLRILSDDATILQAVQIGGISEAQLAYPIDKRNTKEDVEVLRRSEASLDAFWAFLDQKIRSVVGTGDGSASLRLLSQPRVLQRTPQWEEPDKEPKEKETAPAIISSSEDIYKPMSVLHIGPTPNNTKAGDEAPKIKIKTRGIAYASSSSSSQQASEDPVSPNSQPIFQVDARALKVVRTIFHDPSAAAAQGETPWQDFLHTLTSVGFAAEKLYGSVWQFRPVSLDADRSIQFHEPHPRGKIPFRVARRHGRRLARAYGWSAGTFVLKEK